MKTDLASIVSAGFTPSRGLAAVRIKDIVTEGETLQATSSHAYFQYELKSPVRYLRIAARIKSTHADDRVWLYFSNDPSACPGGHRLFIGVADGQPIDKQMRVPKASTVLRIEPVDAAHQFELRDLKIRRNSTARHYWGKGMRLLRMMFRDPYAFAALRMALRQAAGGMLGEGLSVLDKRLRVWEGACARKTTGGDAAGKESERFAALKEIGAMSQPPLISVLMPVYNVDLRWLDAAVASVRSQWYENWELCVVDDCSTRPEVRKRVEDLSAGQRIKTKLLSMNQGISGATNECLAMATGDYVVFLDNDDELTPDALFEVVREAARSEADIVYSDQDRISPEGLCHSPIHKPCYSPDMLLSQNYMCHLVAARRTLVEQVEGLRRGYEGAQDHDLLLRLVEKSAKIARVSKVLYHWREIPGSTAAEFDSKSYAWEAGRRCVADALVRRGVAAVVEKGVVRGSYRIRRAVMGSPLVSVIVPFKDGPDLLETCVASVLKQSTYENFEIIGVSNNSVKPETHALMRRLQGEDKRIRFVEFDVPFNYSRINNHAVSLANGEHLVLLNNDVEIISPGWIEELLGHSQRPEVGAVGGKLYYPNETVQHAGVVIGVGGVAGHSHKGAPRDEPGYYGRLMITQNVSAVTAAFLMVKKNLYLAVGGLDEQNLAVAFNDIDFCLRLREKGCLNVFTPYCEAYHRESISRGYEDTPEKLLRFEREIAYLHRRHSGTSVHLLIKHKEIIGV